MYVYINIYLTHTHFCVTAQFKVESLGFKPDIILNFSTNIRSNVKKNSFTEWYTSKILNSYMVLQTETDRKSHYFLICETGETEKVKDRKREGERKAVVSQTVNTWLG